MIAMLPPIHSIPAETVSHIFRDVYEDYDEDNRPQLPLAFLLRAVCQRWRVITENTPELWSDLVGPYGLEWTRRALAWSKDCSLDLYLCADTRHSRHASDLDEAILLILPALHRSSILQMSFHTESIAPPLIRQALLSSSLPRLEALYIDGGFAKTQILDQESFAGEIPLQLEDLTLKFSTVPPSCLVFQAPLTTLSISNCSIWPSIDALLHTLSGLPLLETLSITVYSHVDIDILEALPLSATRPLDFSSSVRLPRLESIRVRMQVEHATYLFTRISFPTTCTIVVDADLDNIEFDNLAHIYPALDYAFGEKLHAAFPGDSQSTGFRSLSLDIFQHDTAEGVTIECQKPTPGSGSPELFHLAFLLGPQLPELEQFDTLSAITHYVLENWSATRRAVSQLSISHPTLFNTDFALVDAEISPWAQALMLFDTVESLVLFQTSLDIVDAFTGVVEEVLLPRLRRIKIEGTRLTHSDYEDLVQDLKARIGPLQTSASTLKLVNCTLDGHHMSSMDTILKRGDRGIRKQ
ncbi:hypothetical protein PENSPDRAFT_754922, partial [Peniophora sp. CONT]